MIIKKIFKALRNRYQNVDNIKIKANETELEISFGIKESSTVWGRNFVNYHKISEKKLLQLIHSEQFYYQSVENKIFYNYICQ